MKSEQPVRTPNSVVRIHNESQAQVASRKGTGARREFVAWASCPCSGFFPMAETAMPRGSGILPLARPIKNLCNLWIDFLCVPWRTLRETHSFFRGQLLDKWAGRETSPPIINLGDLGGLAVDPPLWFLHLFVAVFWTNGASRSLCPPLGKIMAPHSPGDGSG
ncbi:hypothetical protein QQ054_31595 [Oscillatoria amoena NRMC-F 0135]|nr:hypothetical protein [Oscillatoria amoena NRMC-F 0135]